jgi:outer membrane protein TolC
MRKACFLPLIAAWLALTGCQTFIIDRADRQVYDLIHERQCDALGMTTDVDIGPESGEVAITPWTYDFTPRPLDMCLPESFTAEPEASTGKQAAGATANPPIADAMEGAPTSGDPVANPPIAGAMDGAPAAEGSEESRDRAIEEGGPPVATGEPPGGGEPDPGQLEEAADPLEQEPPEVQPEETIGGPVPTSEEEAATGPLMTEGIFPPEALAQLVVFGLPEALEYADRHARDLQGAKETLYLEALDLTLERHLWTPQWVYNISTEYANYGQVRDFDHAMTAVSDFAVTQRLPYGGDVTARVINSVMRDLGAHTTSGEPGSFILSANLPLLRGAGRAAYESRYSAERELIYAVRTYERFRQQFLANVAGLYFELQELKSTITNTYKSYGSRRADWIRADFVTRMGQAQTIFDAARAKSSYRQAESALVSAKEQYATALDRFKIFIGMSVEIPLDVLDQDQDEAARSLELLLPNVSENEAVQVALQYRLDLRNTADAVDDAYRGVKIAKNAILPDLNVSGSATLDSDPEHLNSTSFNTERTTYRAEIALQMTDRKAERNAYRASLIEARQSERDFDEAQDTVRADVRRAIRRLAQQENLMKIQALQVEENEFRRAAAKAKFDLGESTNQDVVDAENELLTARNDLAAAV